MSMHVCRQEIYYPLHAIDYRLVYNICESDTCAGRPKVPFAVASHKYS